MEEEYLRELNDILKLSFHQASAFSKSSIPHVDNRSKLAFNFKTSLGGYGADISKLLYKIDLSQNGLGNDSLQQQYIQSFATPQPPEPKWEDYVKKINGGYQVFDGHQWVQLSNKAIIDIKLVQNNELNGYKPAVQVTAFDPKTKFNIFFEDKDLSDPYNPIVSFSGQLSPNGDLAGGLPSREVYWEDPMYSRMKSGVGASGLVAGALELREVGNLTPWRTGKNLKDAKGFYRKVGGGYNPLSAQKGIGAGGHQKGARGAAKRAGKWHKAGRKFFWVGIGFGAYEVAESFAYNDSNKKGVALKVTLDITMGAIGVWGGPVGWVISGTYFIADMMGAFDGWSQPTGVRSDGVPYNNNLFDGGLPSFSPGIPPPFYGMNNLYETDFEVEYIPCLDQIIFEQQLEDKIKIDNTYVAPKILFKTNKF